AHRLADLAQRHALPLAQLRIEDGRDHHAVGPAGAVPLVLPTLLVGIVHLAFYTLARGRVLKACDHRVDAALAYPQRQARVEAIRCSSVGILVCSNVDAAGASGM